MGRKKINKDDDETVTITVRNIKREEWDELGNFIGSKSKSDFIRECIYNQINKSDTVTELKKEINDLEYEIGIMQDKLKSKKQELGEILQRQTDNADNELILDTIMKTIKTFNTEYGGISEDKIKGIVREDYNDAIPIQKVLNRAKDDEEIHFVKSLEELGTSKAYNRLEKEKEEKEETYEEKLDKVYEEVQKNAGKKSNMYRKYTELEILEDKTVNEVIKARCKNKGVKMEDLKAYIKKQMKDKK